MSAELFLTCFLACLFAFVVVLVLGTQVIGFLVKRWFVRHLPEIMHAATAMPHGADGREEIQELFANAARTPPGVTPHLAVVRCGGCVREQAVPLDQPLPPYIEELGWRFGAEQTNGWICPFCVEASATDMPRQS